MKMNAKHFRDAAWAQLTGNWKHVVLFSFIYFLIALVINGIGVKSDIVSALLTLLVALPIQYGYEVAFLGFIRTGEKINIESMFDGFKNYGGVVLTGLLMGIYVLLWSLLLIVPGIIKALSYSMVYYIMRDNPELKYNAAIERSMEMMKGHKWELFCLGLSFIGWIFLGIITLCIGFLWIEPYMCTAYAHFYEYVKEEFEGKRN